MSQKRVKQTKRIIRKNAQEIIRASLHSTYELPLKERFAVATTILARGDQAMRKLIIRLTVLILLTAAITLFFL